MKKLLIKLALLAVPMLAAAQTADNLKQSLPSEWGGWQNLTCGVTDITAYSKSLFPMEVETSGKTIHLLWQENGKDADGLYRMYYRRSADLGRTWEEARLISTSTEKLNVQNNHLMTVSGSSVYIFCPWHDADDSWNSWHLRFARSTDGGASFTTVDLEQFGTGSVTQHLNMYYAGCDGQTLVTACVHQHRRRSELPTAEMAAGRLPVRRASYISQFPSDSRPSGAERQVGDGVLGRR